MESCGELKPQSPRTQSPQPRERTVFVKKSRNGEVSLQLFQQDDVTIPVYGAGEAIEGTVELSKTTNVISVDVKIDGTLQLKEVSGGGRASHQLCLGKLALWSKGSNTACASSLSFTWTLPREFSDEYGTYPLPPTYECHLPGFQGFRAKAKYTVGVIVTRSNDRAVIWGSGNVTLSTRFIYFPRSRPPVPLPPVLQSTRHLVGFAVIPHWRYFSSTVKSTRAHMGGQNIEIKLYLPSCRVLSITQTIPFFLTFSASSAALATFVPYGPTTTLHPSTKRYTQIRVLRRSIVNIKNEKLSPHTGFKNPGIWSVIPIGEGFFKLFSDSSDRITYCGEIPVSGSVKNPGFKAAGLVVKDFICLTILPPEFKSPYSELRLIVPIELTTDPWGTDDEMLSTQYT